MRLLRRHLTDSAVMAIVATFVALDAAAAAGNLWIADLYNYWIQHFTPTGEFLGLADTFGAGQSFNSFAVATDSVGHVYVADIGGGIGDRVLVFDGLG